MDIPFKTKETIKGINELSKKLGISSTGDPIKDALAQTDLSPEARAKLSEDIKNKNKSNKNNTKKTDTKAADSDIKSILAKSELTPEDTKILIDYIDKHHFDPKAADSELTKSAKNTEDIKINPDTVDKVTKNLKEAFDGKDSTGVEKEQTTKAKPTEEPVKETPEATTKESTVETPKEPKQETPKNEEKAKKVIDGFDSSQFKFEDAANQELYNLALTNGIGTPIRLATGEIAIPITGTGKSIVVSDKFAKTLDKVKRDDPKEVSATLAQVLGGSPVKGYDAYNYANSKERAGMSNSLAKIFKKIDESSLSKEDKEKAKEVVNEHPSIFKRLFVGGGLFGTAGLVGMGLYNDNDDQNTIEGVDGLKNRLNRDNPDGSAGVSGEDDSGNYSINLDLPNFGDPGSTTDTLQSASEAEPEGTIEENQEYITPDRGHTSEDFKQGNPLTNETKLVTNDTPESTPYNPSYTPKDQMYNTGLSNPIPEQVAEQLAEVANTETPSKSNKKSTKASKATSGNKAPMAGSRPDVSAPGYGAADLSAALGQAAQGAPVEGYDRMFDPSLLEYMRRVSPNTAYGIEQEMRRRGMM